MKSKYKIVLHEVNHLGVPTFHIEKEIPGAFWGTDTVRVTRTGSPLTLGKAKQALTDLEEYEKEFEYGKAKE